jgi:hypothetical protein
MAHGLCAGKDTLYQEAALSEGQPLIFKPIKIS